jgi:hypothetical protein
MFGIPDWALGASVVTVAFFAAVGVLLRLMPPEMRNPGRKRASESERVLLEERQTRLGQVDELRARLADVEERLDFTERLLSREREGERLAPPGVE